MKTSIQKFQAYKIKSYGVIARGTVHGDCMNDMAELYGYNSSYEFMQCNYGAYNMAWDACMHAGGRDALCQ